ncbi:MAG: polysaccharide lyase [Candidatus Pacearchaeota archaeon]|nr:polysaccharide lyase [Candidatus Pacearchaeota archaeon]
MSEKEGKKFVLILLASLFLIAITTYFISYFYTPAISGFSVSNNFNDENWGILTPAVDGKYFERAIVPDDKNPENFITKHSIKYGEQTYRSESMDNSKCQNNFNENVSIRIFIPDSYAPDSSAEILCQWHGSNDYLIGEWITRSPPLALATQNGNWGIQYWWDENFISASSLKYKTLNLGSYEKDIGHFINWTFFIHWGFNRDGKLFVWKNNAEVVHLENISIGYNDKVGNYFKFGIYKWDWKKSQTDVNEREVYHDDYSRECFS